LGRNRGARFIENQLILLFICDYQLLMLSYRRSGRRSGSSTLNSPLAGAAWHTQRRILLRPFSSSPGFKQPPWFTLPPQLPPHEQPFLGRNDFQTK
jgi:hypothetical protein